MYLLRLVLTSLTIAILRQSVTVWDIIYIYKRTNQKEINKSEPTSYSTNLIDTSTTEYTGEADTSTTAYNGLSNEKNTTYNNVKDDNTHVYNDVTDTHNAHIHGNIGVTTATAMMKEYVDFYSTYNFWVKFWELYIYINCRADFCTESE